MIGYGRNPFIWSRVVNFGLMLIMGLLLRWLNECKDHFPHIKISISQTHPVFIWKFPFVRLKSLVCIFVQVVLLPLCVSPLHASHPPPGFSISVVEEDGVQQLYITDVKAGGLAFAKGSLPFISIKLIVVRHLVSIFEVMSFNNREKKKSTPLGWNIFFTFLKTNLFSHVLSTGVLCLSFEKDDSMFMICPWRFHRKIAALTRVNYCNHIRTSSCRPSSRGFWCEAALVGC